MSHRPSFQDFASLCHEVDREDGIDPRSLRPLKDGHQPTRKLLQLCKQVAHTLAEVLAGCGDDVLRDLEVVQVTPASGPGRLLVTLQPALSSTRKDRPTLERHLSLAKGWLRNEVVQVVHRRKAPDLIFEIRERNT